MMHKNRFLVPVSLTSMLLLGCGGGGGGTADPTPPAPNPGPAPTPSATFSDATASWNINFTLAYTGIPDPNLSGFRLQVRDLVLKEHPNGAAAGDCDGDGDIDLFVTPGDHEPNRLYRNQGGLMFQENTAAENPELAYPKSATENYQLGGAAFADLDGDDDLDLVVGGLFGDPALVFRNTGNCIFENVTAGSGLDTLGAEYTISVAFGDYDRDGLPDLLLAHWGTIRDKYDPAVDTETLWRNVTSGGTIAFENVSIPTGVSPSIVSLDDPNITDSRGDFSFTPTFARINDDLWPDVLMVSDYNLTQFFINDGEPPGATTFTNPTNVDVIIDDNGMGSAVGDYDNDGDLDWFVSSIYTPSISPSVPLLRVGNRLYRNDGEAVTGYFTDVTDQAGVASGGWGWGSCFLDIDNDGDLDIYQTNGWPVGEDSMSLGADFSADKSRLFVSDGPPNYSFHERAADFGLDDDYMGRGVVCADFDDDGDVDILLLHSQTPVAATLWENDATGNNNYLRVKLRGQAPNTEAAGARIWATANGITQMREITLGSNFTSANPTVQIFGLGSSSTVESLRVEWPDGQITDIPSATANARVSNGTLTLDHPDRSGP